MSRFPLTVPTASSWEFFAHSRNVIVSLKTQNRAQSNVAFNRESFIQQNIVEAWF